MACTLNNLLKQLPIEGAIISRLGLFFITTPKASANKISRSITPKTLIAKVHPKYVKWWGIQINDTRIFILFADAFPLDTLTLPDLRRCVPWQTSVHHSSLQILGVAAMETLGLVREWAAVCSHTWLSHLDVLRVIHSVCKYLSSLQILGVAAMVMQGLAREWAAACSHTWLSLLDVRQVIHSACKYLSTL